MSSDEITTVKQDIRELSRKMDANTELTRQGFEKVNGRVKKLELKNAYQQGRQSRTVGNISWYKVALSALGVASAAISLALFIAQRLLS